MIGLHRHKARKLDLYHEAILRRGGAPALARDPRRPFVGPARRLWPGRQYAGCKRSGVPVPTAKSSISGARPMPANRMRELFGFL